MHWYDRFLSGRRRNWGISSLMTYIVVAMLLVFAADYILKLPMPISAYLAFDMHEIVQNMQLWRIITFIFMPTTSSLLWIIFSLLLYYSVGNSLEAHWGKAIFTLYYLVGVIGTIICGVLTGYATNSYLNLSLLLAFAYLFPDTQLRLYFLIPVKIKYLGMIYGAILFITAISSLISGIIYKDLSTFASIIASVINFLLFFSTDIIGDIKRKITNRKRRREFERKLRNGEDS